MQAQQSQDSRMTRICILLLFCCGERKYAPAVRRASGSGAKYDTEKALTKEGAGGGPAEELAWTRGRGMRLLKIEEARTRSEYVLRVQISLLMLGDLNTPAICL